MIGLSVELKLPLISSGYPRIPSLVGLGLGEVEIESRSKGMQANPLMNR